MSYSTAGGINSVFEASGTGSSPDLSALTTLR